MRLLLSLLLSQLALAAEPTWPDLATPPAASAGDGSKDAALVIGIEDYAFAQDLPGARENALAWVRWLQKTRGVPVVKPLLDNQATKEEILTAAGQVAGMVKPGGRLWVVYIGHGAPARTGEDGLLIGVDAMQTASSLESRGLPQKALLSAIQSKLSPEAETVLVIDACFSGKTSSGDLAPGLAPLNPVSARIALRKVTALTAAKSEEYAGPLPDGHRPAFSYLVLGALRGWGDRDGDGVVSAQEAVDYAGGALRQTVTGRSQTPSLEGDGALTLGRGRERGPDLVELSVSQGASGETGLGGGSVDFARLAEEARLAEASVQAYRQEQRRRLDARATEVRTKAAGDFAAIAELVAHPSEVSRPALEAFVKVYGTATVTEGDQTEAVVVPQLAKVEAALASLSGVAPTGSGKAGELVVTKSGIRMRVVPAGSFTMGCTAGQGGACGDDGKPAHSVTLTHAVLLGETEVTQGQWVVVMGNNPSEFSDCGASCPVEQVSWVDSATYANSVSRLEGLEECYRISGEAVTWSKGLSCQGYRLPTEAEWERAARAGGDSLYAGGGEVAAVAWTDSDSDSGMETRAVGMKGANAWGLSDMSGNVWEWTWDVFGPYSGGSVTDPLGASSGADRVYRGGSDLVTPGFAQLARRAWGTPGDLFDDLGLRLARTMQSASLP